MQHDLPDKVLSVHRRNATVLPDKATIQTHPGLCLVLESELLAYLRRESPCRLRMGMKRRIAGRDERIVDRHISIVLYCLHVGAT
jgi:hypothetical protein